MSGWIEGTIKCPWCNENTVFRYSDCSRGDMCDSCGKRFTIVQEFIAKKVGNT